MATAHRWSRKRGWAAAFQGAEVVGEHYAANRGGVTIAGPQHISSSVPIEFEAMLGSGGFGTRRPGAPFEISAKPYPRKTLSRHAQARRHSGYGLPRARFASLRAQLVAFGGACGLHTLLRWTLDRHGGLEHGAEGLGPSWLARHGQRQGRCHIGCYLCRESRSGPRLLRALRGDGTLGATGHSGGQLSHNSTFASQSHSHGHVLGSQGTGSQTAKAVPHAGASGTATPGRAIRMDLGCRGASCRIGVGLVGVATRSRSCLEPDPRSLRDPTQAFSGEEQGVGHRANFPRPGNAQRHEETVQQKGRSLACLSPLGGAGGWQPGCLEEGASVAGYFATVCQLARFLLVTRSWSLGSRLGLTVARSHGTLFSQSCNLWRLGRPGHTLCGFRQESHTASSQRCGSGFGTLLEAMGEGSLPGIRGSSTWLLKGWPRRRRWRWAGWAAAFGQSNGDVAAALVGSAQSQRQAACRPGGYGRALAKTFTRRGR